MQREMGTDVAGLHKEEEKYRENETKVLGKDIANSLPKVLGVGDVRTFKNG